jgi:hypothetical protein
MEGTAMGAKKRPAGGFLDRREVFCLLVKDSGTAPSLCVGGKRTCQQHRDRDGD